MIAPLVPSSLRPGPTFFGLNQQGLLHGPNLAAAAALISQALPVPSPLAAATGLFAITLARSFSDLLRLTPRGVSSLEALNRATGAAESALAPARDPLVTLLASVNLAIQGSRHSDVEMIPAAALIGLAALSRWDRRARERRVVESELKRDVPLSPEGWRRQIALVSGVMSPSPNEALPEGERLNARRLDYSSGEGPSTSIVPNLICLLVLLRGISAIRRHPEKRAKEFLFQRTLAGIHEANRNRVSFEGLEKVAALPEGSPVLWATFPHTNVYFDMGAGLAHPRLRFAGDRTNFFDHPIAKFLGWPQLVRDLEIPLVVRGAARDGGLGTSAHRPEDPFQTPVANGIQPAIHFQAGRVPPAYTETGEIDRPGFYSNAVDPKDPAKYAKRGIVFAAVEAARRSGRSAFIPILQIIGAEKAQPKFSKRPPFIQKNTTEQRIVYRVEDVIEVSADANPDALWAEILRRAKGALGIDAYLSGLAAGWTGIDESSFAALAENDERLFVIVDRIRCLPPRYAARNDYKRRLVEILADPLDEAVSVLLRDVTRTLKKIEYKR